VQFEVADSTLQHLHTLVALQQLALKQQLTAPISIALLSSIALEASALPLLRDDSSSTAVRHEPPSFQPLIFKGQPSHLQLCLCRSFSAAAATPNIRLLFIPSASEYLGLYACPGDQQRIITALLRSMPAAQLFPPLSWQQLTCRKDAIFARFGTDFMLPALWIPIPSLDSLSTAARKLLRGRADGAWMLKGSFSACSFTAYRLVIKNGRCEALMPTLNLLFSKHHQRCVGIQPFIQDLRDFELRVFLVPHQQTPHGWRQCVSVQTRGASQSKSDHMLAGGFCEAEMRQPTHGRPLRIAGFIDKLLEQHADFFQQALTLRTPVLRIDCGYILAEERCFLNELVCAVNCGCYSAVHGQDLAHVIGQGLAAEMWRGIIS
jgi:hypothetical protein